MTKGSASAFQGVWKSQEHLLRILHFSSFITSGLTSPGQDLYWFTDEDSCVSNERQHYAFVNAFGNVSSHYLSHNLGHLRVGTTKSDTGKRDVEDLVAIADLTAGTLCEVLNTYCRENKKLSVGLITKPPQVKDKAEKIMAWLAGDSFPLKRLSIAVERIGDDSKLRFQKIDFHS